MPNGKLPMTDNRFIEFTALADIKAGDEILHDYGNDYWDSRT
jgi:SET domain-containing protein